MDGQLAYVRQEMTPPQPAPVASTGAVHCCG